MKKTILFSVLVFLFASCNRDIEFPTISVTEPSLTIIVDTVSVKNSITTYTTISGAEVNLYNSEADFDNNAVPPFKLKTTDQDGKAVFTEADLGQKGIFYVKVTFGTLSGSVTTPYMLLNDGATILYVELN
jgi:hypothetical protein